MQQTPERKHKKDPRDQELGQRLRLRRLELRRVRKGYSQRIVAEMISRLRSAELTRPMYAHYEDGYTRIPATDVPLIAKVLEMSIEDIHGL